MGFVRKQKQARDATLVTPMPLASASFPKGLSIRHSAFATRHSPLGI
jgi:hypothetical protein